MICHISLNHIAQVGNKRREKNKEKYVYTFCTTDMFSQFREAQISKHHFLKG
jgi:hypothetical protein